MVMRKLIKKINTHLVLLQETKKKDFDLDFSNPYGVQRREGGPKLMLMDCM